MSTSLRSAILDIDLGAVRHNLGIVNDLAGDREVIASIKANAYGFGVVEMSRTLVDAGVRKLWTGNIDEAIAVREAGIDAEILLFGGPEIDQMDAIIAHDLQPTIFDAAGLEALAAAAARAGSPARAWVKVDAGMGRLGVPVEDALAFLETVAATERVELRGVYSHLPFNDADGEAWASAHYPAFADLVTALRERGINVPYTQIWGSAGVLAGLPDVCNAVCVGHVLFGLTPLAPGLHDQPLQPALRELHAAVLRVSETGSTGGYGAGSASASATVAIGLSDGLRKAVPAQTAEVLVQGRRATVRAFTLEHLMLDLDGPLPSGPQRATIIGGNDDATISLAEWAAWTGGAPLDVMMSLSGKTPVRYLDA